jgi:hypothetical protein
LGFLSKLRGAAAPSPSTDETDWYTFNLCRGSITSVVGEASYQRCLEQTVRKASRTPPLPIDEIPFASDTEPRPWFVAYLQREPGNPYDANAISVSSSHGIVGYLERGKAKSFQPLLQLLESHGHRGGACCAYARDADNGYWGVVLLAQQLLWHESVATTTRLQIVKSEPDG